MIYTRSRARWAGIFFIAAALSSFVGLALYQPVVTSPDQVSQAAALAARWGALSEVVLIVSVIATAVVLYPAVRPFGPGMALGYVAGRIVEAVAIMTGAMSLLVLVSVPGGALGQAFVALHDWTFLFGPGLAIGINTWLLATLMYRSELVPQWIARVGLVGGPMVLVSSVAVLLGAYSQVSVIAGLAALPVFVWEMSLAVWLISKGFRGMQGQDELQERTGTLVGGGIA